MTTALSSLTVAKLKRAVDLKEQIETLERQLDQILAPDSKKGSAPAIPKGGRKRRYDAAARARFAAAQRARRAREKVSGLSAAGKKSRTMRSKKKV